MIIVANRHYAIYTAVSGGEKNLEAYSIAF